MKNRSNPCVCAWVQMKNATPRTIPPRLRMIAFLRWPIKRSAMYSGEGMRELPIGGDGANALARSEQILIGDDDWLAFLQSLQDLRAIKIAKSDLHGA